MYPLEIPSLKDFRCCIDVQLRFNDIDILGHLNNTVYFSLYDLAKARYMEAANEGAVNWQRVESVIANIDCAYIEQIHFGDKIRIFTRCIHMGEKSFTLQQMMVDEHDHVKSMCQTVMVSYDPDRRQAVPVTETWRRNVSRYEGKDFKM